MGKGQRCEVGRGGSVRGRQRRPREDRARSHWAGRGWCHGRDQPRGEGETQGGGRAPEQTCCPPRPARPAGQRLLRLSGPRKRGRPGWGRAQLGGLKQVPSASVSSSVKWSGSHRTQRAAVTQTGEGPQRILCYWCSNNTVGTVTINSHVHACTHKDACAHTYE